MTEKDIVNTLSSLINEHISSGFVLDEDTIHFIKSGYGLNEADEIIDFLENNMDEAVLDMISYPPDNLRVKIEEFIPFAGLTSGDIEKIEDCVSNSFRGSYIHFNKKIFLAGKDSLICCKKFMRRLNLNVSLDFISDDNRSDNSIILHAIKALLRKKKFNSNNECCDFINSLASNCLTDKENSGEEYLKLIDQSSDFFNGSDKRPFDILSEKKDFYIRALLEYDEFNNLLKSYSMEFIMMKRIQAPLVPVDEAVYMINLIDKITRIVYNTVIRGENHLCIDNMYF